MIAALALTALADAQAQPNSLVGSWRGVTSVSGVPVTVDLTLQTDMRFSEQEVSYGGGTMQMGVYMVTGDQLSLTVLDWVPRSGARPPGGTYVVRFLSPNTILMHSLLYNSDMRFDRVGG